MWIARDPTQKSNTGLITSIALDLLRCMVVKVSDLTFTKCEKPTDISNVMTFGADTRDMSSPFRVSAPESDV